MKNLIIISMCLMLIYSCQNADDSYPPQTVQGFYVLDKDGSDLLKTGIENTLNTDKIKIFYSNNNKMEEVKYRFYLTEPWVDPSNPNNKREYYCLNVSLNNRGRDGDIVYTYIQWNENDMDTIQSEIWIIRNTSSTTITMFNDSIWSPKLDNQIFTIIK